MRDDSHAKHIIREMSMLTHHLNTFPLPVECTLKRLWAYKRTKQIDKECQNQKEAYQTNFHRFENCGLMINSQKGAARDYGSGWKLLIKQPGEKGRNHFQFGPVI